MTDAEANMRWFAEQFDWIFYCDDEAEPGDDHLEEIEEEFVLKEARRKKQLYKEFADA